MTSSSARASRNLWSTALGTLDPKHKASLAGVLRIHNGNIVASILEEAERKKQICLQKRWKVHLHGKTIVLRDIFDKIIAWVNQFKAVVDVAVQFDTTGASLPWAESVSLLIARYAAFESLYAQKGSHIQVNLHSALTSLYGKILVFLADGIRYFNQSSASRFVKSVFQTSQNEELEEISKLDGELIKLAQIVDSQEQRQISIQTETIQRIAETLRRPVCRLIDSSTMYTKTLENDKFYAVLKWLSTTPYYQHHQLHSETRLSGSAQWLLDHPRFKEWKGSSSSSLFLLHGIPGSGKTHLTSAVIESFLNESSLNPLSAPVAYFYCGDSRLGPSWADPDEIMLSLVRQFAIIDRQMLRIREQVALEYARREAEAKLEGLSDPPRIRGTQAAELILSILSSNPATIVVDGVDEIEEHRRHELLDQLIRVRDESASVVKIFISSRDNVNVMAGLPKDALVLRIQETDTRHDVELYVDHCVRNAISTRSLLHGNVSDDLQIKLKQFLLKRAGEMFLWVRLQVERLRQMRSTASLMDALQNPDSVAVDHLYFEILKDVAEKDPVAYTTATRAFSWLLCMHEPLSPAAFLDAVSNGTSNGQKPTLSELLSICSNLIVVDNHSNILRFAHVSFKEFLEAKPEFDRANAHCIATKSCLDTCIQCPLVDIPLELHPESNYQLYAALYWGQHYSAAAASEDSAKELNKFVFDDNSLTFHLWLEAVNEVAEALPKNRTLIRELTAVMSGTQTPLFAACIYGLRAVFDIAIQGLDVNGTNLMGHTGLYLAAAFGRQEIVEALLGLGADPNISRGRYADPLSAACAGSHLSVAQVLLHHEAYSSRGNIQPALSIAFSSDQEDIVSLLLEAYVSRPFDGQGVGQSNEKWLLDAAAQTGFIDAIEKLEKDQSTDALSKAKISKLAHTAIRRGHTSLLKKLIDKGPLPADVIATAALFGQTSIIEMLLDKDYDIEEEGQFGTPLRCASLLGHENTVRTLVSRGANPNKLTAFGDALQAAAMKGHLYITNMLIQLNAKVDNQGGFFGTALQAAAYRGHRDVAKALLIAGARIEHGGRYKDAFHAASEGGHEQLISLFLAKGYLLPAMDTPAFSRIRLAGKAARKKIGSRNIICLNSRRLSKRKPEELESTPHRVPGKMKLQNSALEVAAFKGHEAIVERIVAVRKSLGLRATHLGAALWAACQHGHDNIVERILSVDSGLGTFIEHALECAAKQGHISTIGILIPHVQDTSLPTILVRAGSQGGQKSVVWRGFELAARSDRNLLHNLALAEAVRSKRTSLVGVLLESGFGFPAESLFQVMRIAAEQGSQSTLSLMFGAVVGEIPRDIVEDCFHKAILNSHGEVVRYIIAKHPSTCNLELLKNAFVHAAHRDLTPIMAVIAETLIEDTFYEQFLIRALCCTSASGALGATQWLLHAGVQVDAVDHRAPVLGPHQMTKADTHLCCLKNVHSQERLPSTPLISCFLSIQRLWEVRSTTRAMSQAKLEGVLCLLLENGANPNQIADGMDSPLHIAVRHCSEDVVRLLISKGANVNIHNTWETLLHCALKRECHSLPIVSMLLDNGAISECQNDLGTALEILLSHFQVQPQSDWEETESQTMDSQFDNLPSEDGLFPASGSIREILSTGPGAVVQLLLLSQPDLLIPDLPFGLLLQMTAVEGDFAFLKLLIDRGADVNSRGYYYGCALQAAARFGHLECVKLLLSEGAKVNLIGGSYATSLHAAVYGEHSEVVTALITRGADVNLHVDNEDLPGGSPPLLLALKSSSQIIPEKLLIAGASIDNEGEYLHLAVKGNRYNATKLIISAGDDVNGICSHHMPPLITACLNGDVRTVDLLLTEGADPNVNNAKSLGTFSPLGIACNEGYYEIARILLTRGADPNGGIEGHNYPLESAASIGNLDILKLLFEFGARGDDARAISRALTGSIRGQQPLQTLRFLIQYLASEYVLPSACMYALPDAYRAGDKELSSFLWEQIPKTAQYLNAACALGSDETIEEILSEIAGMSVEIGQHEFYTLIYHQREPLVSQFIQNGVNVRSTSPFYGSQISAAVEGLVAFRLMAKGLTKQWLEPSFLPSRIDIISGQHIDGGATACGNIIGILLRAGAEVNPSPTKLGTPLQVASCLGDLAIVNILLDHGADINADGGYFGSALIASMFSGQDLVSDRLLDCGINVNIPSERFGSALHYACKFKDLNTVQILLERGAGPNSDSCEQESLIEAILFRHRGKKNLHHSEAQDLLNWIEVLFQYQSKLQVRSTDLIIAGKFHSSVCSPYQRPEVLECLLNRSQDPHITIDVVKAALENDEGAGLPPETLQLLLLGIDNLEPDPVLTGMIQNHRFPERGHVVVDENPNKFDWNALLSVFKDSHLYLQVLNIWSNTVPNYGLKFTLPQIMRNMGYTAANAQLLSIPPYIAGAISACLFALLADRLRWRMPVIVTGQLLVIIAFSVLFSLAENIKNTIAVCYFAVVLACIGLYPIIPGTNAWTSNNLAGPRKQGMGIAFMLSIGNAGGLIGSFIYIEAEAPMYPTGFGCSFAFAAAGVIASIVLELKLWHSNKRNDRMSREEVYERYTDEELQRMGDRSPFFKYIL
ncbi:uncharacterized protein N7500_009299 [Penicillium coprophilum]|uniref:uncharacterized protein n=1 Tax=Penicillium coprophilum TaxID=36646 RepID=UPI0023943265|nr:uncharacterized protein N7500_009299 [Penicillium coprophilum]KAJ5153860.1 hypothetical protein N7500_009299 [Penicillium coprophilum]